MAVQLLLKTMSIYKLLEKYYAQVINIMQNHVNHLFSELTGTEYIIYCFFRILITNIGCQEEPKRKLWKRHP